MAIANDLILEVQVTYDDKKSQKNFKDYARKIERSAKQHEDNLTDTAKEGVKDREKVEDTGRAKETRERATWYSGLVRQYETHKTKMVGIGKGIAKSMGIAVAAVSAGALALGKSGIAFGQQISDLSDDTGVLTDKLQQLAYMNSRTTGSFQVLESVLFKLQGAEGKKVLNVLEVTTAYEGLEKLLGMTAERMVAVGEAGGVMISDEIAKNVVKMGREFRNSNLSLDQFLSQYNTLFNTEELDKIATMNANLGSLGIQLKIALGQALIKEGTKESIEGLGQALKKLIDETDFGKVIDGLTTTFKVLNSGFNLLVKFTGMLLMIKAGLRSVIVTFGSMAIAAKKAIKGMRDPLIETQKGLMAVKRGLEMKELKLTFGLFKEITAWSVKSTFFNAVTTGANKVIAVVKPLYKWFNNISKILKPFTNAFVGLFKVFGKFFIFVTLVSVLFDFVKNLIRVKDETNALAGVVKLVFMTISDFFVGTFDAIINIFVSIKNAFSDTKTDFVDFNSIVKDWIASWEKLGKVFDWIWDKLKTVFSFWLDGQILWIKGLTKFFEGLTNSMIRVINLFKEVNIESVNWSDNLNKSLDKMTGKMDDFTEATENMRGVWDSGFGARMESFDDLVLPPSPVAEKFVSELGLEVSKAFSNTKIPIVPNFVLGGKTKLKTFMKAKKDLLEMPVRVVPDTYSTAEIWENVISDFSDTIGKPLIAFYDKLGEAFWFVQDSVSELASILTGFNQNEIDHQQRLIDKENERWALHSANLREAGAENTTYYKNLQRAHDRTVEEMEVKKRGEQAKQWNVERNANLVQIAMDTATGIMAAFKSGPIIGLIMAGVIGALGIGKTAVVAGQKNPYSRASGGFIPGFGTADNTPVNLTPGEFVVNRRVAQENADLLDNLNKGKSVGSSNVTITINGNVIGEDEWVRNNLVPNLRNAILEGHKIQ